MSRTMYDSTSPWDIPRDAEMVAYYVDGKFAWPQSWLDMFPNAVKVSISAVGTRTAQVGDVEVGCIWPPANAVPWVLRARGDGFDPTIYVNERNDWGPVRQAFQAAGVPEPHYWVANYDGVAAIPPGAVAKQYAHPSDGDGIADRPWETGAHYDKSVVADYWPGVDARSPGGGGSANSDTEEETMKEVIELPLSMDDTLHSVQIDPRRECQLVLSATGTDQVVFVVAAYHWAGQANGEKVGTGGNPVPQNVVLRVRPGTPLTWVPPKTTAEVEVIYSTASAGAKLAVFC